jgi:hypothetical protein
VQAALAMVEQAPVVGLTQHPVACASVRCGENDERIAPNMNTIGSVRACKRLNIIPSPRFASRFIRTEQARSCGYTSR